MLRTRNCVLMVICILAVTLAGCTSSQVRLRYLPESELAAVTMKHNTSVGLVQFTDARPTRQLGEDDGKALMPVSNVAAWVSHGLEDQLTRHGVFVDYVLAMAQLPPTNIVTVTVEQLTITPLSQMEYKGEITLNIAVNDGLPTTYKASLVKQGVPYTNIIEPLLAELLNDVLNAAVPEILSAL